VLVTPLWVLTKGQARRENFPYNVQGRPAGGRRRRPSSAGRATISESRFIPSQTAILLDLALGTGGQLVGRAVPGRPLRSLVAEDRSAAGVHDRTVPEPRCSRSCSQDLTRRTGILGPYEME
jgi:hypothetical protein